jgi:chromosome segregation ATPase
MNTYYFLITACDLGAIPLLLALLLPFLLGYLTRFFLDGDKRTKLLAMESENANMKADVAAAASYKSSFSATEGELKKMKLSFSSLEANNKQLKADLDAAIAKAKPYEGIDISGFRMKIAELETANLDLRNNISEMSGLSSSLEDVTANANAMKQRFAEMDSENMRLKSELRKIADEKERIVRSEESISGLREDIRVLSGKLGGVTVENERLKAEAAEAKAKVSGASSDAEATRNQLAAAEATVNALRAKETAQAGELQSLKDSLAKAESYKATADNTSGELAAAKEKLTAAEMELSSSKLKLQELEKSYNSQNETLGGMAALKEAQARANDELGVLRTQNSGYENELKQLQQKLAGVESEKNNLHAQIQGAGNQAAEITALKQSIAAAENERNSLQQKLNEAAAASGELQSLKQRMGDYEAQLGTLKTKLGTAEQDTVRYKTELDNCRTEKETLNASLVAAATPVTPDDLKVVEGIGPKIEELCNKAGIYTFKQLAAAPVERLKQILHDAGSRFQMHDPTTWPQQSDLAAAGKWDELKVLQDKLNAGKE